MITDRMSIEADVMLGEPVTRGRKALLQEWVDGLLGRTGESDDGRVFELIGDTRRFLEERQA
jgi:hypothetical protein